MDLINKEVTHKRFGKGYIVNLNEASVEVHFDRESKKFVFPDAFGKYLKLHDEKAAHIIEKVIEKKEMEQKQKQLKLEEERKQNQQKQQLRSEFNKMMKQHKLHPESQVVFWCDDEEQEKVFTEWTAFTGVIKSGKNKGTPKKLSRLQPNSACLLTARDSKEPEKNRRILGVFMVSEDFIGKLRDDGYIPSHPEYRLKLTEEESKKLPFWNYYFNEKSPHKITWNTGKYRYFDNVQMSQILQEIVSLKNDPEEKEQAQQFLDYFCRMNHIISVDIPKPNGALSRLSLQS